MHGPNVTGAIALILGLVVLVLVFMTARKGGRWLAVAVGVVTFPFVLALLPASWFWGDGRYITPMAFLLAMAVAPGIQDLALGLERGLKRWAGQRSSFTSVAAWTTTVIAVTLLLVATVTTVHSFAGFYHFIDAEDSFTSNWTSPDAATSRVISQLESVGIHDAYADYWVAYKVDLLSGGKIARH